jgi:hypothetical protein
VLGQEHLPVDAHDVEVDVQLTVALEDLGLGWSLYYYSVKIWDR